MRCSKCNQEKPTTDFYKSRSRQGSGYCILCCRKNAKDHRVQYNKHSRDWTQHYKELVFNHYGRKCNCCGETISEFLSVDHVNNDGATHRQRSGYNPGLLYKSIVEENFPSKYQILCMNCQFGKLRSNGICPHIKDF